jgi:hypothetical protein
LVWKRELKKVRRERERAEREREAGRRKHILSLILVDVSTTQIT